MSADTTPWGVHRPLAARLVIEGTLELRTPAAFGSGDSDGVLDMLLLRDPLTGSPLLPGTSIAGALRAYLLHQEKGYRVAEAVGDMPSLLFGGTKGDEMGLPSLLTVDDALAMQPETIIRDGVRIDPQTRTAQDQKKFDYELLPAGTTFRLQFELALPVDADAEVLLTALARALQGFEQEAIRLGIRKQRGFGQCIVRQWRVTRYDLQETAGMLAWLASGLTEHTLPVSPPVTRTAEHISAALDLDSLPSPATDDQRQHATLTATFTLASPLLIRSTEPIGAHEQQPDVAHLRANGAPVVPGTSVAGALRARALRILHTLAGCTPHQQASKLVDELFGHDMDTRPIDHAASRLRVDEVAIHEAGDYLVQQRVGIDRFTGGAFTTALFSEAPLTSGVVTLTLLLQSSGDPTHTTAHYQAERGEPTHYQAELGLLLLLLKDLWTGDLPLGGTSSIGRGRLQGSRATLTSNLPGCAGEWTLTAETRGLQVTGDQEALETYVKQVQQEVNRKESPDESHV
jgi:CRISPR/Cas system CSM-associated protein Csm3 (group 7 of RAMP superfamily)